MKWHRHCRETESCSVVFFGFVVFIFFFEQDVGVSNCAISTAKMVPCTETKPEIFIRNCYVPEYYLVQ